MFRDRTKPTLFRAGTVPETVPVRSLATTVIWCRRHTCHHTHVTREVNGHTRPPRTTSWALQRTCRWDNYRRTLLFVQRLAPYCSASYVRDGRGCTMWDHRDGLTKNKENAWHVPALEQKMFRDRPNRRCSGPEQYQKQFRFDLYSPWRQSRRKEWNYWVLDFWKQVSFKPWVKERRSYGCAECWIRRSYGWRNR